MERKIKHLRTDNGLEYFSKQFNKFCRENGITKHKTVKQNPQQNGLAKHMNGTILEKVKFILPNDGLPKRFWREAMVTTCYLINKCLSTIIHLKTPIKM